MGGIGELGSDAQEALQQVLGYLNFSSGAPDTQFLGNMNRLFAAAIGDSPSAPWPVVCEWLESKAIQLRADGGAFQNVDQVLAVLDLLKSHVLPGYRQFHSELLAHQNDTDLFNSFFVGRAAESVLAVGLPWDEIERIEAGALQRLNDYIGHRPVATLEGRKIEPYKHERLRPIPLMISGAGIAVGRYHDVVERCAELLTSTSDELLREAFFDPSLVDELALDPRAYDFDHPVNKRPNYHFGQWDPHQIDNSGFYRRFVVQQVTVDALLSRVDAARDLPREELLVEAAAVLAGTILMSSGISGYGPDTHDSSVTLSTLLPRIANYRDAFYEQLLERVGGSHGARLKREAQTLRQPFGAARQDLNRQLTQRRARQLEQVQLAKVFAQMDYPAGAQRQIEGIDVPSARLGCRVDCLLSKAQKKIEKDDLEEAIESLRNAQESVRHAIECGAMVDPWNILGFDGHFSLFPALENSIRDHRIDELIEWIEAIFQLYARLWSGAAASAQTELAGRASSQLGEIARWWHEFAAHQVESVDAQDPLEIYEASRKVAEALRNWHAGGAATGDIGFWAPHVQEFDSCRAYALVIDTLVASRDSVAALGVLVHWLSQADHVPLEQGDASFHHLALQWVVEILRQTRQSEDNEQLWARLRKFFDYFEANAGDLWVVPRFEIGEDASRGASEEPLLDQETTESDEEGSLFSAAYEGVVYRDSTDDGIDGSVFDFDETSEDQLQLKSHEVLQRLAFLDGLAVMWKLTAVAWCGQVAKHQTSDPTEHSGGAAIPGLVSDASRHIERFRSDLASLSESISRYQLTLPSGHPESMVQYDRFRLIKESLLEQTINTQVRMAESGYFVAAAAATLEPSEDSDKESESDQFVAILTAALCGDTESARAGWVEMSQTLSDAPILYVPLSRGGQAKLIVDAKIRQQILKNMLHWLPRLGLLDEAYELLELARKMERGSPVGPGAVTEFDDLFEIGCSALVTSLIDAHESDATDEAEGPNLISCLEEMMEPLLRSWLSHSRTLRLSVLEQVVDQQEWDDLVDFIRKYGRELFTQRFLNLGNVRGILHQGVARWLARLEENEGDGTYADFVDAISDDPEGLATAEQLTLILEAVVENYGEYRDYNSTTTQSDRGDLLFTLLDFLRLRTSYDRVMWNLRPIVLAHQVLVRHGREVAAATWRGSLQEKISGEADKHVQRLMDLQKKYAMRLPSVSERLNERFMRPLQIDRLCAMIEPAMIAADEEQRQQALAMMEDEVAKLVDEPSGAGLDVPGWLLAMEDEVQRVCDDDGIGLDGVLLYLAVPPTSLSFDEVQSQIDKWKRHIRPKQGE